MRGGSGTIAGNSDPLPKSEFVQIVRPHDFIRKVCNFRDHALAFLDGIDYPLGVMRSVRVFTPVFDGL